MVGTDRHNGSLRTRLTQTRALFGLAVAALTYFPAAFFAQAATPLSDSVKLIPSVPTVESAATLPPEVKALEAQTASHLFDRNTTTLHTAYDVSQVYAVLAGASDFRAIKIFGAAPYTLSVFAEVNGVFQAVSGLQNLNLTTRADAWSRFDATGSVTTGRLRLDLTPASGSSASGLREIEFWSGSGRINVKDATAACQGAQRDAQSRSARGGGGDGRR